MPTFIYLHLGYNKCSVNAKYDHDKRICLKFYCDTFLKIIIRYFAFIKLNVIIALVNNTVFNKTINIL